MCDKGLTWISCATSTNGYAGALARPLDSKRDGAHAALPEMLGDRYSPFAPSPARYPVACAPDEETLPLPQLWGSIQGLHLSPERCLITLACCLASRHRVF